MLQGRRSPSEQLCVRVDVAEGDLEAREQPPDRDLAAHLLAPYGRSAAIENVGVSAAPLLAGFSFALVGLILGIQNPGKDIAEPNIALAALVVAALLLVNAVQCAFHARQYYVPPDEWVSLVELFPEGKRRDQLWENQVEWSKRQATWTAWTRRLYNLGVLVLFGAVAVTLLPPGPVRDIDKVRLVAVGLALTGLAIEFVWVLSGEVASLRKRLELRKISRAMASSSREAAPLPVATVSDPARPAGGAASSEPEPPQS